MMARYGVPIGAAQRPQYACAQRPLFEPATEEVAILNRRGAMPSRYTQNPRRGLKLPTAAQQHCASVVGRATAALLAAGQTHTAREKVGPWSRRRPAACVMCS